MHADIRRERHEHGEWVRFEDVEPLLRSSRMPPADKEQEMQRLRNIGSMDVVSRFLTDAVQWLECDLQAHGEGPSGGYRSRSERAREAHEAWLNRPAAPPAETPEKGE